MFCSILVFQVRDRHLCLVLDVFEVVVGGC